MMIVHILLAKPTHTLSADEEQQTREAIAALSGVPGVQNMTWGPNFSARSKGYEYAAVMHFSDRQTLQRYQDHSEHKRIVQILNELVPDRLVIDYEDGVAPGS